MSLIDKFIQRLSGGMTRTPLLRIALSDRGRLLDCAKLAKVRSDLPKRLLAGIIKGISSVPMTFRPPPAEQEELSDEERRRRKSHADMYDMLNRRVRSYGDLARRETGVHAVWFGYPIIEVHASLDDSGQKVLAPLFLWPVKIIADSRREGKLVVSRTSEEDPPRLNLVLGEWLKRMLDIDLPEISQEDLLSLDFPNIAAYARKLGQSFQEADGFDRLPSSEEELTDLARTPQLGSLRPDPIRRLHNAAVLGYLRWQHESILADLNELAAKPSVRGIAEAFVSGTTIPSQASEEHPPETDKYLVTDSDFSQETAIWRSRCEPGAVIHGPPGTGKSQTIVNVVADSLAHGQTVLMICQKQAATRVVMERLRKAHLDSLCIEVHDSESERTGVFREIREQVQARTAPGHSQSSRESLADRIEQLEGELDAYAKSLYERHPDLGLSYREVLAQQAKVHRSYPTARMLRGLGTLVRDINSTEAEQIARHVKDAGNIFGKAQPLTNIWRHRQTAVHPGPAFSTDLNDLVREMLSQEVNYKERIDEIDRELEEAERAYEAENGLLVRSGESVNRLIQQALELPTQWLLLRGKLDQVNSICRPAATRPLAGLDTAISQLERHVSDRLPKPDMLLAGIREVEAYNDDFVEQLVRLGLSQSPVDLAQSEMSVPGQELLHDLASDQVLPEFIDVFVQESSNIVQRLAVLAAERAQNLRTLVAKWLDRYPSVDPGGAEDRCREAMGLAGQLAHHPVDTDWQEGLASLTEAEHQQLHAEVRLLWDQRRRLLRFFATSYRRSKREVRRRVSCDKKSDFWSQAESLKAYVEARALRRELDDLISHLVPNQPAHCKTDTARKRYVELALSSLHLAMWISEIQSRHPWVRLITSHLTAGAPEKIAEAISQIQDAAERLDMVRASLMDWTREAQDKFGLYVEAARRTGAHRSIVSSAIERILESTRSELLKRRADITSQMLQLLTGLQDWLTPRAFAEPESSIRDGGSLQSWCQKLLHDAALLPDLIRYEHQRTQLSPLEDNTVNRLEEYERELGSQRTGAPKPPKHLVEANHGEWWDALVKVGVVRTWRERIENECPDLAIYSPEQHTEKVKELKTLLSEKRTLEIQAITELWLERQSHCREARWNSIFQLRSSRNSRSKRLREAIDLGRHEGLFNFRPCWLVNPETAARIFPLEQGLFDIVIFDEASQCVLEQAIPAIYRGKRLVVSGDEKQLPPTSFFMAANREDYESDNGAEEAEATDEAVEHPESRREHRMQRAAQEYLGSVDNLLDAAVDILPETYLDIHYRSEHPELINFSNHAFYSCRLEMPPARADRTPDNPPFEYHDVGGIYDDRKNKAEAKRIVELLREIWCNDSEPPTIGVVTFNRPQCDLIEEMVQEACQADAEFAAHYEREVVRKDGNQDIGFFVKNLENVQGDERDYMLFSTTFGKPPSGSFARRFGPVGAKGGERRLNVAVTRAKKRVLIVGSMPLHEICPALNTGVGAGITPAGYLQLYLSYVKALTQGQKQRASDILGILRTSTAVHRPEGVEESPLEVEIREAIHAMGFAADTQVGVSGFRIDLAVRHPDPGKGYVLGVECDGATYHSSWTARARDVWRQGILESRGWRIHRIWSTEWWDSSDTEKDELKRVIEESIGQT